MKNKFELGFVEKLVFSNYKIRSKAIQVNGEIDDNFKLVSKDNTFFFNDTATTEIYTRKIVGSVRCV